jgi:hypothetical protein
VGGSESKCNLDCHEGRENTHEQQNRENSPEYGNLYNRGFAGVHLVEPIKPDGIGFCFSFSGGGIYGRTALAVHEPPRSMVYLQSPISFSIAIDIQPTSAGEWRDEQMKCEHWLQYKR